MGSPHKTNLVYLKREIERCKTVTAPGSVILGTAQLPTVVIEGDTTSFVITMG